MKLLDMFDVLILHLVPEGYVWSKEDKQLYNTLVAQLKNLEMQQLGNHAVVTNITMPKGT